MRRFLPLVLLLALSPAAMAQEGLPVVPYANSGIIADVSQRNIAVTTGFSGATTTLFGALPEEGDVIVVVSGPLDKVVVRRKERFFGVWLNRNSVTFDRVPGFYWVGGSRRLPDIVNEDWMKANRVGTEHQRFTISDYTSFSAINQFRDELIHLRQQGGLYSVTPSEVVIMGGRLYRADVHIPAYAPTGNYTVTTYLFRRGEVLDVQQTPLSLRKEGAMDDLSHIAQSNSLIYAMLAVSMALLTGWSSAVLMRRS